MSGLFITRGGGGSLPFAVHEWIPTPPGAYGDTSQELARFATREDAELFVKARSV